MRAAVIFKMGLILQILEWVGEHGRGNPLHHPKFHGYSYDDIEAHVKACIQAKLVDASKSGHARALTLAGQAKIGEIRQQLQGGQEDAK